MEQLKEGQMESYIQQRHKEPAAACVDLGLTRKNARIGLTGLGSRITKSGISGCMSAVVIKKQERSLDGEGCWTISGLNGKIILPYRCVLRIFWR